MALTGTQFWDSFLNLINDPTSVRSYYLPQSGEGIDGEFAKEGEWANVIDKLFERTKPDSTERQQAVDLLDEAGFWAPTDDLDFWVGQDVNDLDKNDLRNAAEARFPTLFGVDDLVNPGNVGVQPVGQERQAEGGALSQSGVLSGGTLTRIDRADGTQLWGMTYVVNGIEHVFTFDSVEAMQTQLGNDAVTSGKYGFMTMTEDNLNDGDTWLLGDAASMAGQQGSYNVWFGSAMTEAALEAGVRNPGAIGDFLSQPEVQRILAEGAVGEWSDLRIQAELRTTDYFQNTLYPGITTFMNQGIPNPEAAYWSYMNSVTGSLSALGYAQDADGTYKSKIGEMLGAGISASAFNTFTPTFVRAEQSPEFAAALNKWTEQDLGVSITFEDWFDVLAGNAGPELSQVVEKATLTFAAEQTGTSLSDAQISRLAGATEISEAQMRVAFNTAEEALLSVGRRDLARFGLTEEALVSAAFGVESVGSDPLSSDGGAFTAAEVQKRARKAAKELGIQDDRKAQFFVGFDSFGAPTRQGLSASAPEFG